jgi:hypothetical protein
MEFYSATNKNEMLSFVGKRKKLQNIIVSDVSQIKKAKTVCFLSYVEHKPNANSAIL